MNKQNNFILFTWLLVLYEVACALSIDAYMPAMPSIAHQFHASHNTVQYTITAWLLGTIISQLIVGPLSEHYGRRAVLLYGGVIFILSSLCLAIAPTIHFLIILRFIQGGDVSSMLVTGYAAVHELFATKEAIHTLAKMQSITILAPAFGPLLGGMLLTITDWRWILGVLAI